MLDALFTQSPVGLHVLDTELRLVRINTATRSMLKVPVEGLLGRHFTDVEDAARRSPAPLPAPSSWSSADTTPPADAVPPPRARHAAAAAHGGDR
ncbi:PAS domain-containing protein [Streptomyces xanthophaeus]|uniref:PAS domain-containing protein n=1 Tax=Streptomyces xanthophaeus TaxID=67385 RepID=UPI0038695816|nr:PAS domain-containing protein [Streptomyces xanthophaeus]WST65486.1 PAS domain-containing protein [Streptomyces xanthophaeus]